LAQEARSLDDVTGLASDALVTQGFSAEQASAVARTIARAERDGCESHGLFRVPFYVKAIAHPGTNAKAHPILSELSESVVRVDAACGFCPNAYVAPAGGTKPVYGTNPMAFAWPRAGKPPMVFDQASSASARGEIQLHLRDGKPLPEGWAIDAEGKPTTDPQAALGGAQLTFGGYKGAAIALMVELLAGALIGERTHSREWYFYTVCIAPTNS